MELQGSSFASHGIEGHEVVNVGDSTGVFLIIEPMLKPGPVFASIATRINSAWDDHRSWLRARRSSRSWPPIAN